jgi:DNA-binding MarR family transcriptional regulator
MWHYDSMIDQANKNNILNSPIEIFTRNMFTEVIQKLSAFLAEGEFSLSEIAALHVIDKADGLSLSAIAERLNLSNSATSRLIAGLENKKLLLRKTDSKDSRAIVITCSKVGRKFLDNMSIERAIAAKQVIHELPSAISKKLLAGLANIERSHL